MKAFRSRPDDEPGEPESVAHRILGEEPGLSAAEVAERTGIDVDAARRLWRALGFPEHGEERAYNTADVAALTTLVSGFDSGLVDFDLAVTLTRAVGQTMARLADWEVAALVPRIEELQGSDHGSGSRLETARQLLDEFGGPFEELLIYSWRRHLAAAVARMEALGADEEDLSTSQLSVGFADIVSFTALSNDLSRERIGDLVEVFESRCADVVARNNGRMIKSIGDSVLFVNDDPIRAYDTAEGIISVIGRDKRMPDVRVGLASGSVVMRMGDVFGPPVNMAARLTAVARRNRIIIDAATARLLPDDQFETRRLPARPMRGFGILEPVAVRRH
jgi:adenylate cyclase